MRINTINAATDYISLDEAKTHLRVEHSLDDAYITLLIEAVLGVCEVEQKRPIIRGTFDYYTEVFDFSYLLTHCHKGVLVSASLEHADASVTDVTTEITINRRDYALYGGDKPTDFKSLTLTYTAGYLPSEFPRHTKLACLALIGHYFEQRSSTNADTMVYQVPFTHKSLFMMGKKHLWL